MIKTIFGTKGEMLSKYDQFGRQMPVTYIVADTNIIVGQKDQRFILAFGKKKKAKKPQEHFVKTAGYAPRFIKEIVYESAGQSQTPEQDSQPNKISIGDKINVSVFSVGDLVKVTGTTRGKGFAGSVKRWGFAGGPKTHGQSDRHRALGSIGAGTTPGRVFKGKKMAGHMGATRLTVTGLEIIEVNSDKNYLLVKGSVPGPKNGLLIIEKTGKAKVKVPQVSKVSEVSKVQENKEAATSPRTDTSAGQAENTEEKSAAPIAAKKEQNAG